MDGEAPLELPEGGMSEDEGASFIEALLKRGSAPTEAGDETPDAATEAAPASESEETETAQGVVEDEPEAEEEATEEEETSETEEAPPAAPDRFKVKVDGNEVDVTLEDLKKSYSFTAHLTRKSQALAEERRSFDSEKQALTAERARLGELLGQLEQALTAPEENVDWDALRRENPIEFAVKWGAHQQQQERRAAVKALREENARKEMQERQAQFMQHQKQQQEMLLEARPAWKDEKVHQTRMQELVRFAINDLHYTEQDLRAISDHRLILVLDLAEQQHRAAQRKPTTTQRVREAIKTAPPGPAAAVNKAPTALTKARQRAAKTGSIEDAADFFLKSGLVK